MATVMYVYVRMCVTVHALPSFTGHLDQWDLLSLTPRHSLNCQGGPVWCIAANPTTPHQLAVGSEDGMVCFNILDNFCVHVIWCGWREM